MKTHAGPSDLAGLEVRAAELGGVAGLVGTAALVRQSGVTGEVSGRRAE